MKKLVIFIFLAAVFALSGCSSSQPAGQDAQPDAILSVHTDVIMAQDLEKMAENADLILEGRFTEYIGSFNSNRNPDNPYQPDPDHYSEGRAFSFMPEQALKGELPEGEIAVAQMYSRFTPIYEDLQVENPLYIEPILGEKYILFLEYSPEIDAYCKTAEPFMILIDDSGTAQLQSKCIGQPGEYSQLASAENGEFIRIEQDLPSLTDTISGMTFEEIASEITSLQQE